MIILGRIPDLLSLAVENASHNIFVTCKRLFSTFPCLVSVQLAQEVVGKKTIQRGFSSLIGIFLC